MGLARRPQARSRSPAFRVSTPPGGPVSTSALRPGGFTDVLLARGAARVHAVDVGHGQLAWKLRTDPRVAVARAAQRPLFDGRDHHGSRSTPWYATRASSVCRRSFRHRSRSAHPARGQSLSSSRNSRRGRLPSAARAWSAIRRCTGGSATACGAGGRPSRLARARDRT